MLWNGKGQVLRRQISIFFFSMQPPFPQTCASIRKNDAQDCFTTYICLHIVTEEQLIRGLTAQDRNAQKWLYERYAPLMFSVCKRYLRSREDAEEALVSGFYKVFSQIEAYSGAGSFEGWIRRIMVNEALMMLRKTQILTFPGELPAVEFQEDGFSIESDMSAREIMELLDALPNGYRTVFNLYVLEGYKHQEIADMLGISINTSKSQLILAKEKLRKLLQTKGYI
jgi:RNA polymerase sigma-70 factor (ECF subfamily)